MGTCKKTTVTKGQFKDIVACEDGTFMDDASGEIINLAQELYKIYKDSPFELTTSFKSENPIE